MRWIEIKYKCRCLKDEVSFQIRERLDDEDIMRYMNHVQHAIGVDHNNRSPLCISTTLEYAKIPVQGEKIGGALGGTA